jgi:hypothetical protein
MKLTEIFFLMIWIVCLYHFVRTDYSVVTNQRFYDQCSDNTNDLNTLIKNSNSSNNKIAKDLPLFKKCENILYHDSLTTIHINGWNSY